MPFPLQSVRDGDWQTLRGVIDNIAQRLNPVLPQARVFNSANIATVNNIIKTLTFDSEAFDEGALHSTSANTDRLTAPITGIYEIGCGVSWASNATGARLALLQVNGGSFIAGDYKNAVNGDTTLHNLHTTFRLAAGDYVTVSVKQSSGGALNVLRDSSISPEFWMVRRGGYTNEGV